MTPPKQVVCPKCGGRGTVPWATDELGCDVCEGKGTVTPQKASAYERSR